MTKDTIPENFTIGLTLVDAIPVALFGLSFLTIGLKMSSPLFISGAIVCILAGAGKVLWKLIVCTKKKNVWPLFIQMRILMPLGFLMIILSLILNSGNIDFSLLWSSILSLPSVIFFAIGIIGMILMSVFAVKLDSSNAKSNWIEQITNSVAQLAFLLGILFC